MQPDRTPPHPPPQSRPISGAEALAALRRHADPTRAAEMAARHKAPRACLGVAASALEPLIAGWRAGLDVAGRTRLAGALWDSEIHEARIAAAKLLTQARLPADEPLVWAELLRWVPAFDGQAVADQACKAIERRLRDAPARLDLVEGWTGAPSPWMRRAALVATLPWAKLTHPSASERAARERILGWAEALVPDRHALLQSAIAAWLGSLSVHDPARVRAFLDGPGRGLTALARRDAARRLR